MDISLNYNYLKPWNDMVTQKINEQKKSENGEICENDKTVPSLEVVQVVLVQCNLVDNQYVILLLPINLLSIQQIWEDIIG